MTFDFIRKSIFRKLLFSNILTVLLGLCAVGLLLSWFAKDYIVHTREEELLRQAKRVNLAMQQMLMPDERVKDLLMFFDQSYDTRIWMFDLQGRIVATSSKEEVYVGKSVDESVVKKVRLGEDAVLSLEFAGLKEQMLSVVVPWGLGDKVYGGIVLHAPIKGMNEAITSLRESILWVTLIGIVISAAIASYLSWSISRPLQLIDRTAAKIGMGDYQERIQVDSKDEIGDLAATINHMVEKLARMDIDKRRLEQIRQDFLANVSHELGTPLTAVQGFLEALQDGLIDDEAAPKYYDIMYKETLHMSRLVDDILDLVRLENQEIAINPSTIDVDLFLKRAAFKFAQEAAERGTVIEYQAAPAPLWIYADPDRLEQILNNLVKNAVKFTEAGSIRLEAEASEQHVVMRIVDTGDGISEEDQDMIWERFFKADRGRSKKNSGTGLGLAIVKQLVELHQGSIQVQSKLGEGTTFVLSFPAREQEQREERAKRERVG
jgi:signal transduction histidine kinase